MPILSRLHDEDSGKRGDDEKKGEPAAQQPKPDIIQGRPGYASFSLAALEERITEQINEELAGRIDILLVEADQAARRNLVRQAGEYVLAVEFVPLSIAEKEALFETIYNKLFGMGPLEDLFADTTVTQLTIEGFDAVSVQRIGNPAQRVEAHFESNTHLMAILERLVAGVGGQLLDEEPIVEFGMTLYGRPARLSLVCPPVSPVPYVDIRVHSNESVTLARLQSWDAVDDKTRALLQAIVTSPHGVLIVGEAASGKTTVLEALLHELPKGGILAERTAEVRLRERWERLSVVLATADDPGEDFATQISAAADAQSAVLALDELRGDEGSALWPVLAGEDGPRLVMVMRGSLEATRLHSAFSMAVRKGQPEIPQAAINAVLMTRLPFVVQVRNDDAGLHVQGISEWVSDGESDDSIVLQSLIIDGQPTRHQPGHELMLGDEFWEG